MPRRKSDAPEGAAGPEGAPTPEGAAATDAEAPPGREAPAEAGSPPPPPLAEPAPPPDPDPALHAPGAPAESQPTAMAAACAEAEAEHHEEHAEEEAGMSFAARALLFLLILIAGAALGIWAAPRLAPQLPSALAPVAEWLAPVRQESEARLADLEARIDAGLGGMDSRLTGLATSGDVDNRIAAAVAALEGQLAGQIEELRASVGQIDGADTRQRLARLESTLEGQAAELATLKDQLASGAAASAASEETAAEIDLYRAELDGLRAEMGELSDQVAALGARVDEVQAAAERRVEAAESRAAEVQAAAETARGQAELRGDRALVRAALASGAPFEEPLARIAAMPGVTVPEGLAAAAPDGVATMPELRDRFPAAAHAAIAAGIQASAGGGLIARSSAFLQAQLASRSLTPQEGSAPDAVLSRVEERLQSDDLAGALAEAEALPSEATAAMSDWLADARLRLQAVEGLAALDRALPATN